jgi:hypothetical protein
MNVRVTKRAQAQIDRAARRGFIHYGKCEAVTNFQDSDTQVRIIRMCKDSTRSTFVPVRLMRFPDGWLVVRG